jgi:hypothetical protein
MTVKEGKMNRPTRAKTGQHKLIKPGWTDNLVAIIFWKQQKKGLLAEAPENRMRLYMGMNPGSITCEPGKAARIDEILLVLRNNDSHTQAWGGVSGGLI